MRTHRVSRHALCPGSCCSRFGLGFGQFPTPAPALLRPDLCLDPCLRSRPDPGLCLYQLPSPVQALGPGLSSRPGPARRASCPCLESTSGPDWSVPLCLYQSSRPAPAVGLYLGPRCRGLCPCRRSSSGPEAGPAPCWPLGFEATHPSPPVSEAAVQ